MTKREFLKELEDRLQMLDEKERKDMIEEYSQHISMCMKSGMKEEEEDIVEAFDAGADDYLVKPVALAVLLKHIEAVLRRTGGEPNQVFYYQDFSLDYDRKEARIQGQPVVLTPKEYGILEVLTRNQKKVVTKRMLLEQVWDDGGNFVGENTLHVTLNRLKKKIEPDPAHPVYVKNVFGLGYTFGE